jgi:surfactin synthase thioesterase subunit
MIRPADSRHADSRPATAYLTARPQDDTRLRLFCLHHAGGGASIFGEWQRALGPTVAVLPVQLPGRERRVREPRFTDMASLVADLDEQLDPYLDVPHVFYGHSMGALVAWNLAVHRSAAGRRLPEALLAGAANPPHVAPVSSTALHMSQDQLVQWLLDAGGISEMVLQYPEWVRAATAMLRDDLDVCNSHRHEDLGDAEPLPCPIHAFAGESDTLVGPEAMTGWARHSRVASDLHTVPGGHLFVRDSPDYFLGLLGSVLARVGPDRGALSSSLLQEGIRRS